MPSEKTLSFVWMHFVELFVCWSVHSLSCCRVGEASFCVCDALKSVCVLCFWVPALEQEFSHDR